MKNIYEAATLTEILDRINTLTPVTQRKWGTMDVAQMMAHCSVILETATGDRKVKQSFLGMLMAPIARPMFMNEKPYKHDLPTDKSFIVANPADFNKEKERLVRLVKKFAATKDRTEQPRHVFLGKMTSYEWSRSTYKHLDHHLQQFGA